MMAAFDDGDDAVEVLFGHGVTGREASPPSRAAQARRADTDRGQTNKHSATSPPTALALYLCVFVLALRLTPCALRLS